MICTFHCVNCNKENTCKRSTTNTYCDNTCQHEYQRRITIETWLQGLITWSGKTPTWVRFYLEERDGKKCSSCNNTHWLELPITLECDHIDGNSSNNNETNLRLICPNCHSMTPTYKAKNKGNGRHSRRQRYANGKSF